MDIRILGREAPIVSDVKIVRLDRYASGKCEVSVADFTPISAAIGGGLIGLAIALLMLLNGRIGGISGIFGGVLGLGTADKDWRIAFVAGLILWPPLPRPLLFFDLYPPRPPGCGAL